MEISLDVQLVDLSNLPYLIFSLLNSLFVAAMLTILWMLARFPSQYKVKPSLVCLAHLVSMLLQVEDLFVSPSIRLIWCCCLYNYQYRETGNLCRAKPCPTTDAKAEIDAKNNFTQPIMASLAAKVFWDLNGMKSAFQQLAYQEIKTVLWKLLAGLNRQIFCGFQPCSLEYLNFSVVWNGSGWNGQILLLAVKHHKSILQYDLNKIYHSSKFYVDRLCLILSYMVLVQYHIYSHSRLRRLHHSC